MRRQLIWALLLVVASFGFASAQETTSGSIAGTVVDAQGAPIPGATVSITSNQGTKTFVTDTQGRFFAPFLTPTIYAVKVELTGFSPVEQKNIQVRLGQRADLGDLTMKVGGITEVVEVVGAAPVIDTNSTTAGGVLDSDAMSRLPVGRNFTATLYLVPGVSDSSGAGSSNPSIGGGSGLENNYIVDGVNITDSGFGGVGSYNAVFGSIGTGVTTDFIKETQVKTAGFEAEYGQATGGVVNVVTKSGSNDFNGAVFGYFRPEALEGDWDRLSTPQGTVNTTARNEYDFGISVGGPLVKDKAFFFATLNPQYQRRTFVAPAEGTSVTGARVVFPFASAGEVDRKRKSFAYAGKLTWQANSNHRFDISAFGDPSKGELGLQRFQGLRRVAYPGAPGNTTIQGAFSEIEYGGHNQTLRYDGIISPSWLIEASVARSSNKFTEDPAVNEPLVHATSASSRQGRRAASAPSTTPTGRTFSSRSSPPTSSTPAAITSSATASSTRTSSSLATPIWTGNSVPIADGRTTVGGAPVQVRTGGGVTFFRATRGRLIPAGPTTQKYFNFFVQDTWQVGRKLTIKPGLRWERQHLTGVTPGAGGAPNLCFDNDSRPGAGDGSGSAIPCTFTWDDNWAPRIGLTYDIAGNGRSKLFAAWGRFYAKIPNDLAARAMSADTGITRQNYRDAALTQPVPNGTAFAGATTHLILTSDHAAIIDPESGSTYKDEFVGGFEFEAARSLSLGIRYIHRNMGQILEDIGELPVAGYFLEQCGDAVVDYFITNLNTATNAISCPLAASFETPVHKYDAVEFTANKSFSDNWSLDGLVPVVPPAR